MERVLVFDSSSKRSAKLYQWLYSSFAISSGAGSEQGEKGVHAAAANAEILNKLDSVSEGIDASVAWPGLNTDEFGYNARRLNDGKQEIVLKESELARLERVIDSAALRFTSLIQRDVFHGDEGLFEFLKGAEKREKKPSGPVAVADKAKE